MLAVRHVLVGSVLSAVMASGAMTWVAASVPPPDDTGLAVSYLHPPPVLAPVPFATVPVSTGDAEVWVAITNDGGAIVVDIGALTARVVAADGTVGAAIPIHPPESGFFIAGPNDVLYGVGWDEESRGGEIVAIPLTGELAGTAVARQSFDGRFIEAPRFIVAQGATGIIDINRNPGDVLMPYVDGNGDPLAISLPNPYLMIDDADVVTAVYPDGGAGPAGSAIEWPLQIEWAPDNPGRPESSVHLYAGPDAPVATVDGGGAWITSIGPLDPGGSEVDPWPTMPVIVELFADGTARWWSNPDDWYVASMDIGGVLLGRETGDGALELSRLSES